MATELTPRTYKMILPRPIISPKLKRDQLPDTEQLALDFEKFMGRLARYEWLEMYYTGQWEPLYSNRHTSPLANYCQRFTDSLVGYITGNPPAYSTPEDNVGKDVTDLMTSQNMEQTEGDVIMDMCIFGGAYQLTYLDDEDINAEPKTADYRPMYAYVTYDGTVKNDSVYGAIVTKIILDERDALGQAKEGYRVDVYTAYEHIVYIVDGDEWTIQTRTPHTFAKVPLIEFRNGRYAMSVFESIIGLQDAYNALLSDRVEDKRKFSSSALVLKGQIIGKDKAAIEQKLLDLKDVPVIQIDSNAEVGYITKTMNESDNDILQKAISNEMYLQVGITNLSDKEFAGQASGIAIQFKLLGLDLLVGRIKSSFNRGFMRRVKLYYAGLNNSLRSPAFEFPDELDQVQIIFKVNIPTDLTYEANAITAFYGAGLMSRLTALENISMIEDAERELQRLEEDDATKAKQQVDAWGGVNPGMAQPNQPPQPTTETTGALDDPTTDAGGTGQ